MSKKTVILVMGLSGSGKTTFSKKLSGLLDSVHFNADEVRKDANDWDFSAEGRIRQARRMRELADKSECKNIIIDMICPLKEMRKIINPDIIVFVNRITSSKYKDTDSIFETPTEDEARIFCTTEHD
jgi:adenylylsulfate kinase